MKIIKKEDIKDNISKDNNVNFILPILKKHIGNLIDDFIKHNSGQILGKYNSNMFALWSIESFNKVEEELKIEFNKILESNKREEKEIENEKNKTNNTNNINNNERNTSK